jgi:hypothetical protein
VIWLCFVTSPTCSARPRTHSTLGGRPEKLILDVDVTLVGSHSDKRQAAGNYRAVTAVRMVAGGLALSPGVSLS